MEDRQFKDNTRLIGVLLALGAVLLWGLLPLYWKLLKEIPADEILAHRVFWSCIFLFCILAYKKKLSNIKEAAKNKKNLMLVAIGAITVSVNWGLYIWSVNSDYLVEASMGYYINPLIVVTLATVVLKEKLNRWQVVSIMAALVGVAILTIQYGQVPWISLALALSFALYGLCKKLTTIDSLTGLMLETLLIMPIALGYILFKEYQGTGSLRVVPYTTLVILSLAGIATATPLMMFGEAAKRVPLSLMGFAQYITPTISLILGVFVYHEEFTRTHFISFGFIWCGLLIFSLSQIVGMRKLHPKQVPS
ncbi:chloramphenicol-sensitive protein RarD [Clostridium aceticum]|uniref:Chloramphenicol-sensitive protein RarD n=1 Tax=Clostridium aceticum TaxID=84022 RepID=A0A0D8I7Q2_9CLOT|nr:EamA family transporter RarD [Clostridium aceticum]AKL97258.1 chloramphenicol-sensitive protein RarD [Clostridium aceticum]KJF26283.1 transporter [Clostridium aceticum]